MAAVAAIRANPVIKDFYARLRQRGLHPKAALIGCMRKLLVILNAMLRSKPIGERPPRVHRISPSRAPVFNTVAAKFATVTGRQGHCAAFRIAEHRPDSNGRRNIAFSSSKILIQGLGGGPPSQGFSRP
jgi:hypothetical protein